MKRQKDLRNPKSTEDLWLVLQDVWNNLPAEFLQKLCASVPRRIDAVLKAKGGHTKYWFDLDLSSVHSLHFINWWKETVNTSIFESILSLQHFFHTCLKLLHSTVYQRQFNYQRKLIDIGESIDGIRVVNKPSVSTFRANCWPSLIFRLT